MKLRDFLEEFASNDPLAMDYEVVVSVDGELFAVKEVRWDHQENGIVLEASDTETPNPKLGPVVQ